MRVVVNGSSGRMQGKPYLECQLVPIEGKSDGGLECLSKSVILHWPCNACDGRA